MSITIIDGKAISSEIKQEVKTEVEQLKKKWYTALFSSSAGRRK